MFSIEPVERLSSTQTSSPLASRASARWRPRKPAPPVIKAFIVPSPLLEHVLADRLVGLDRARDAPPDHAVRLAGCEPGPAAPEAFEGEHFRGEHLAARDQSG